MDTWEERARFWHLAIALGGPPFFAPLRRWARESHSRLLGLSGLRNRCSRFSGRKRRRAEERGLYRVWQFIRVPHQQAHLPHLGLRQRLAETWHSGESDAICHLPIAFSRRIVGHALALKQLRWLRKHPSRDRSRRTSRGPVAYRTMFPIHIGAREKVGFVRRNRNRF